MKKPIMKKEVAISYFMKLVREIVFYSTDDAATEFERYGQLTQDETISDKYRLAVDPRFDFDEVVEYVESYG